MRRPDRALRLLLSASLAGAAAVVASGFTAGPAHADPTLLGWTSSADANAFDFVVDDAAGLAGNHPLSEADLPEDTSDFESGPFGHALASIFWPGATAGNAGSLAGELPLPAQLAPLFHNLNDPVQAQTFYPAGPSSASYPPGSSTGAVQMTSHAGSDGVSAKAGLTDVSVPALFEIKGVHGITTATATSTAQASASASFSDLSLLGGLIDIGATTSTAAATSDGVTPSGKGTTHMGAITIAGHSVSVGSDGLVVGPARTDLADALMAPTVAQVQQLISMLQLKIVPLPQTETRQAPAEKVTSAGLQLSFSLPSSANLTLDCSALPPQLSQLTVICTLPGLLQGASFTSTIGRVTATAIATPPFTGPAGGDLTGASGGSAGGSPNGAGSSGMVGARAGTGGPAGAPTGGLPTGSVSPAAGAPSAPATRTTPGGAPASLGSLSPVSLSSPVKAGLLVFLLVLAALAGGALVRMTRTLDATPPGICPLEERG